MSDTEEKNLDEDSFIDDIANSLNKWVGFELILTLGASFYLIYLAYSGLLSKEHISSWAIAIVMIIRMGLLFNVYSKTLFDFGEKRDKI